MTARSSSSSQKEYKKAGLVSINFPPNNGDLNPIEAVWAKLNKDLAAREFEDLRCVAQFLYLPKTKGGARKGDIFIALLVACSFESFRHC